ncbi:hypothetical protein [Streptomyces noursei]|uniref:hypothetical protein n=1 Tax=Streptomyces noursei TaxID=1971 RepID=UPI0016777FB1|nr:hypothetical protein [Streptomyces noursei]MCZ1021154.1 hypothetical protein [Streptomyces noursei]GGX58801.1 hypothetical protein GCM10010341_92230 [Streptomyces noursei]
MTQFHLLEDRSAAWPHANRAAPPAGLSREAADRLRYLAVAVAGEKDAAADCLRYSLARLATLTDDVYCALPAPPPSGTAQCFAQALHETQMRLMHLESLHRMNQAMHRMASQTFPPTP